MQRSRKKMWSPGVTVFRSFSASFSASFLASVVVLAGCTTSGSDSSKPEVSDAPVSVVAPVSPVAPVSVVAPVSTLAPVALSTGPKCVPETGPVGLRGEVTFVRDAQVWSSSAEGLAERCLYTLGTTPVNSLSWSPDGTALLLGPDLVAKGNSITKSGYLPTNTDVNWSTPNGSSLLATTATGDLVKRNSSNAARTDISFLDEHRKSAYHPAGKAIASIGTGLGPDGSSTLGIWVADNTGADSKLVISDQSAAELDDLAYSANGDVLFFTAKHETQTHLHTTDDTGALSIAFESSKTIAMITSSASEEQVAVTVGDCSGTVETWFGSSTEEFRSLSEFGITGSVTPVGWLPGRRLAVLVRPGGCSGPGQLRVVHIDEATSWVVADGVSVAAVRSPHAIPNELSALIGAQVIA